MLPINRWPRPSSPSAAAPFEASADLPLEIGETEPAPAEDENVKIVGPLRIGIPLFNIYLNEADELSRRLTTELAEWAMELHRPIGETPIALAHSLAGSSATVGFNDLSHLARMLEHAQMRSQAIGHGTPEEARLFVDAAEEVRRLLHQFAAGFLKEPSPELLARLAEHEIDFGAPARGGHRGRRPAARPPAVGALDEAPDAGAHLDRAEAQPGRAAASRRAGARCRAWRSRHAPVMAQTQPALGAVSGFGDARTAASTRWAWPN